MFAQRASRDKSVYGEVMRGWFTDWGVVGTITAVYTRVKVNTRIPYANMVVDAANVSDTFLCFPQEGQKVYPPPPGISLYLSLIKVPLELAVFFLSSFPPTGLFRIFIFVLTYAIFICANNVCILIF